MAKGDFNLRRLDEGQLDLMFSFLRAGMVKPNIPALKEYCDQLRQAMIQKTAGQRADDPEYYVEFGDIGTIINSIVIEAMALYLSGALDKIEQDGGDNNGYHTGT
jgi:hypothetical protein